MHNCADANKLVVVEFDALVYAFSVLMISRGKSLTKERKGESWIFRITGEAKGKHK